MATGQWPTLADIASRHTSDGRRYRMIAEMLSQSVVLQQDMPYIESSEMFGHEFVYRTSIPAGFARSVNMGVPYSKSTTGKARVGVMSLEDYSQVDRLLAEGSGDVEGFRESEDVAFLEGMGQTVEQLIWYANVAANPAEFNGLSTFYNTISTANAPNAANVIDGGGVGTSNASIWLLGWSPRTLYGVYPKNTRAGLSMEDKADTVPAYDSLGNRFEAYTSWFRHMLGIVPHDWRFAARICNIDVTTAGLAGPNALDIFATLRRLMLLPPTMSKATSGITDTDAPDDPAPGVRWVLYCNRTVRHWMDVQAMRNRNVLIRLEDYAGRPTMGIDDIPIKVSDQLLTTEATLT